MKRLGRERGLGGEFEASRSETTRPTGKKRDWSKSTAKAHGWGSRANPAVVLGFQDSRSFHEFNVMSVD